MQRVEAPEVRPPCQIWGPTQGLGAWTVTMETANGKGRKENEKPTPRKQQCTVGVPWDVRTKTRKLDQRPIVVIKETGRQEALAAMARDIAVERQFLQKWNDMLREDENGVPRLQRGTAGQENFCGN